MDYTKSLLDWYQNNKRDLPWRKTKDPYRIWVSEIILQQTRVDQGMAYYTRFLERFPDLRTLAGASEEDVLAVWKGLGYYSRARNMHATAQLVVTQQLGIFPSGYKSLIQLKGIGKYTAAAIASICGNEAVPVVDGNVIRVFSRLFGIKEAVGTVRSCKQVFAKAAQLIDTEYPGEFNQAVMEFGALWCKPANPDCAACIFADGCYAFKKKMVDKLPASRPEPKKRERFFNYLYFTVPDRGVVLTKRTGNDIWKNLWELPLLESTHLLDPETFAQTTFFTGLTGAEGHSVMAGTTYRHLLSHQIIHARFFILDSRTCVFQKPPSGDWIVDNPLESGLPVSRLTERFLLSVHPL